MSEPLYRVHYHVKFTSGQVLVERFGSTALDKQGVVRPEGVSKADAERWADFWNRITTIGTKHWIESVAEEGKNHVTDDSANR